MHNIVWFTNLKKPTNKKKLILTKSYNPTDYEIYDNYNAINVNKVSDIPKDYLGYIGVPITYLGQHCLEQFEIIDFLNCPKIDNKNIYKRIFIKRKI